MQIGMLWYDDGTDGLAAMVRRAAEYYQKKYGKLPTVAYVHPSQAECEQVDGVRIRAAKNVMKKHVWMGVEQ